MMNESIRKTGTSILLILAMLILTVTYGSKPAEAGNPAVGIIFVDVDAAGAQNGESWENAYTELQDALDDAGANPDGAVEIWVADGIYTPSATYNPSDGLGGNVPGGQFAIDVAAGAIWPEFVIPSTGGMFRLRDDLGTSLTANELSHLRTFDLPDDVAIYGGFQGESGPGGGEHSLAARPADLTTFRTILTGDISGDDLAGDPVTNKGDNVWHVVTTGNNVLGTGVNAVLNGITIEGGYAKGPAARANANPTYPATTGPVGWDHDDGGGVRMGIFSDLTLDKVVVRDNHSRRGGGGINSLVENISSDSVGPTRLAVTSSRFTDNSAGKIDDYFGGFGGGLAMAVRSEGAAAILTISGSYFEGNSSLTVGGAVRPVNDDGSFLSVTIDSSKFIGNSADIGGAVDSDNRTVGVINPSIITDTLFRDNIAKSGGAIVNTNTLTIIGSIFEQNRAEGGGPSAGLGDELAIVNGLGQAAVTQGGGAIVHARGELTVKESIFAGNVATEGSGGAIENATIYVTFPLGPGLVGAAPFGDTNLIIEDSVFENNSAALDGGAVSVDVPTQAEVQADAPEPVVFFIPATATATTTGSKFNGNNAGGDGGAIHDGAGTSLSAVDNRFLDNVATKGGGVLVAGDAVILDNCFGGNEPDHLFTEAGGSTVEEGNSFEASSAPCQTMADILDGSGVPGQGIDHAPGLDKPFNE